MKRRQAVKKHAHRPQRSAAWFVVVALLFNLAAGFVLPGSVNAAVSGSGLSVGGDINTVVICSPNGLRVMQIGPDGQPLPEPQHRDMNCVHCLSLSGSHGCGLCDHVLLPIRPDNPNAASPEVHVARANSSDAAGTYSIRAPPSIQ